MNKCGSFPLFSAPHSLFSIWTNLKRSEKIPGAPAWRWGKWVLLYTWALQTSPKFTTGIKYQLHQDFWPDQRSRNPNHPSSHLKYSNMLTILIHPYWYLENNISYVGIPYCTVNKEIKRNSLIKICGSSPELKNNHGGGWKQNNGWVDNGEMKFKAGENGRTMRKMYLRLRFVHYEIHMEWPRR